MIFLDSCKSNSQHSQRVHICVPLPWRVRLRRADATPSPNRRRANLLAPNACVRVWATHTHTHTHTNMIYHVSLCRHRHTQQTPHEPNTTRHQRVCVCVCERKCPRTRVEPSVQSVCVCVCVCVSCSAQRAWDEQLTIHPHTHTHTHTHPHTQGHPWTHAICTWPTNNPSNDEALTHNIMETNLCHDVLKCVSQHTHTHTVNNKYFWYWSSLLVFWCICCVCGVCGTGCDSRWELWWGAVKGQKVKACVKRQVTRLHSDTHKTLRWLAWWGRCSSETSRFY